ncbi:MAG: DNA polymerase III subunit delta' [Chloroflexi bacterium]|nr:DNA polymerase III subunit delta' [Chloroflexota bacterium]
MWQIIGQDRIVDLLKRSFHEGRLSHAYLFIGPKHVGKMTLSINLAQALNCLSEDKPCCECNSCRRIASGNHADVQLIQLAQNSENEQAPARKAISVNQIRDMQYNVNLKPYEGGYRVIIIDGAEYMSDGAANSLLKTLEEPPPNTVFLLLAVDEGSLLPTIRSRCQKIELPPLPSHIVKEALMERWGIDPSRADLLARACQGSIGWAISAIDDEGILEERSQHLDNLIALSGSDITERFEFAADLATQFSKNRVAVRERLQLWLTWWRDLLLVKGNCLEFITNNSQEGVLGQHAAQCSTSAIGGAIRSIQETMQQLEQNANPRLALEVLMLNIPYVEKEEICLT